MRLYRESPKENGNYYNGLYRDYRVYIEVGHIGMMENKMETTIMEKKMETTVDNGKETGMVVYRVDIGIMEKWKLL